MQYRTTQGIILKSLLYQEKERILNVYTKEFGITSFIVKELSSKKSHLFAVTSPLLLVEFHYTTKNSDWFIFKEGVCLEDFSNLRSSLPILNTAATLARMICDTFLPKIPNEKVFELLIKAFKNMDHALDPELIASHFLLKSLVYEGLIDPFAFEQENPFSSFSSEELKFGQKVLLVSKYSELKTLQLPNDFFKKAATLFYAKMEKTNTPSLSKNH